VFKTGIAGGDRTIWLQSNRVIDGRYLKYQFRVHDGVIEILIQDIAGYRHWFEMTKERCKYYKFGVDRINKTFALEEIKNYFGYVDDPKVRSVSSFSSLADIVIDPYNAVY